MTTTLYFNWTTDSTAGINYYVVSYRLLDDPTWIQFQTSGTSTAIPGLAINRIYAYQVETVAVTGNFQSAIANAINITDPGSTFSPTSVAIALSFANLSVDIDMYTTTIALASSPGTIIATHLLEPAATVTDTFNGLTALTNYVITVTPSANQFFKTFSYTVTTLLNTICPAPLLVSASITTG